MVEQFCKSIIQIEIENNKALANVVMGLASQPSANSVVELSLSPCYHYQYSSINKAINSLHKKDKLGNEEKEMKARRREVEKKFVN